MYTEDDLLPISALQHLMCCERQWALIHLEQGWRENVLTSEGRKMHERVHETESETRGDVLERLFGNAVRRREAMLKHPVLKTLDETGGDRLLPVP